MINDWQGTWATSLTLRVEKPRTLQTIPMVWLALTIAVLVLDRSRWQFSAGGRPWAWNYSDATKMVPQHSLAIRHEARWRYFSIKGELAGDSTGATFGRWRFFTGGDSSGAPRLRLLMRALPLFGDFSCGKLSKPSENDWFIYSGEDRSGLLP